MDHQDASALKELAEQKEKEWRRIQEQRIEALETTLKCKNQELNDEKAKFNQLKTDFKYNLKLLEERDADIEKFEQSIIASRKQLAEKNSEISELKIQIDELKKSALSEKNALDECKKYYMNRLTQKQNELEAYKANKDSEINKERNEIEKFKRTLQRQLQDLQFDLEKQRTELKTEFDEILRKREHEWRMQTDEFSTELLAKDLQIKMVTSELDQLKETHEKLEKSAKETEESKTTLERKLKEKEWELRDTNALKEARIKELESKMNQTREMSKSAADDLSRKYEEMDKTIREKSMQVENLKQSLDDASKQKQYLEQQINEYKVQIKQINTSGQERERERDKQVAELNEQLARLKQSLEREVEEKAKVAVNSDLTTDELKQKLEQLQREVRQKNADIENLRVKLTDAIELQNGLEHEKLQINLDWLRKYNNLEKMKAQDGEQFTRDVMAERDKALEQVRVLEDKLSHKENVIKALQTADPSVNLAQFETSEFQLREENEKLKTIIKQMRQDMENLAADPDFIPTKQPRLELAPADAGSSDSDKAKSQSQALQNFESDLQRQLLEAKQRNRQLQSQIDEFVLKQKLPEKLTDNAIINSHIKSLNETIASLKKEKLDLTAFTKKQQSKLSTIEKNLSEKDEQIRVKQTQIETLQYELSSQTRRTSSEVGALKQAIANLELELDSTRKEADEYHKATIEKNSEVASLETKVSELKMKLSTSGNQINFGAQELFIQQLQDEIARIKKLNDQLVVKSRQLHHELLRERQSKQVDNLVDQECRSSQEAADPTEILKSKLKKAVLCLEELSREKTRLIDANNQLRGELNRIKDRDEKLMLNRMDREARQQRSYSPPHSSSSSSARSAAKEASPSRLKQFEKRQYELTKKQLTNAKQKGLMVSDPVLASKEPYKSSNYESKNSDSIDDDDKTMNSSVRSENLKEIWKLLDENENETMQSFDAADPASALRVNGIKPSAAAVKKPSSVTSRIPQRDTPVSLSARATAQPAVSARSKENRVPAARGGGAAGSSTPILSQGGAMSARLSSKSPKPKIRNYNIKS